MIRSLTGLIHTIAACVALLSGLVIFLRPKATSLHRALGYVYSLSMVVLLVTAFSIYHLTRSVNFLHVLAVISTVPLCVGLLAAFRRQPRGAWIARHYYWMCWSYVGLCAAFAAEMSVRLFLPYLYVRMGWHSMSLFWTLVAVASSVVTAAGAYGVKRNSGLVKTFNASQSR